MDYSRRGDPRGKQAWSLPRDRPLFKNDLISSDKTNGGHVMKTFSLVLVLFAAIVFVVAETNAQVYKWVDKDGGVHFTDTPTEGKYISPPLVSAQDDMIKSGNKDFYCGIFYGLGYASGEFDLKPHVFKATDPQFFQPCFNNGYAYGVSQKKNKLYENKSVQQECIQPDSIVTPQGVIFSNHEWHRYKECLKEGGTDVLPWKKK